jgi:cell division protein FtsI/penicillin-binding protein 2
MVGIGALGVAMGLVALRHLPMRTVEAAEEKGSLFVQAAAPAARMLASAGPATAGPDAKSPAFPSPSPAPSPSPSMAGLDLSKLAIDDAGVSAPLSGHRVARLTLDAELQQTATRLLRAYRLPEAAIVMVDPATGHVLVYASHTQDGKAHDLASEASAPAASVFKIITAAALVEQAGLTPDTRQCYSGGEHEIRMSDLEDNPRRDRWCTTLGGAMGRSINTVFARLALKHLKSKVGAPGGIEDVAKSFGFDEPVPFDLPVAPSTLALPSDPLGFARTAAGFWNSTLSPLQAAWMSTIVARGGDAPRLRLVREVLDDGKTVWSQPSGPAPGIKRVVSHETAQAITAMMEHTVSEGTSYRAFRDRRGAPFLPDVPVAGKTGTLTAPDGARFYTWFTGFAPSRPREGGVAPVAVAVLVVNKPAWKVKANVVAREMLRAYFAQHKVDRVSKPKFESVARR